MSLPVSVPRRKPYPELILTVTLSEIVSTGDKQHIRIQLPVQHKFPTQTCKDEDYASWVTSPYKKRDDKLLYWLQYITGSILEYSSKSLNEYHTIQVVDQCCGIDICVELLPVIAHQVICELFRSRLRVASQKETQASMR